MADYRRARWGLRRTFQTEQAIEQLSVFDNVAMIHEHSGAKRAARRADVLTRDRVRRPRRCRRGQGRRASAPASGASSRSRGRSSASRGSCCSTSPAAGLPDEETEHLSRRDPADPGAVRRARRSSSTTT